MNSFDCGVIDAFEKHAAVGLPPVEGATKNVAGVVKTFRGGKWMSPTTPATLQSVAHKPQALRKQALDWRSLLKKKAKKPFKPSFQGHTKAIQQAVKPGTTTSNIGKVTTRAWDPMRQAASQKSVLTNVPGWTR